MKLLEAIRRGLRRASSSLGLLLVLWLVSLAVAAPFSFLLGSTLSQSFGGSLMEDSLSERFDTSWFAEFEAQADGLASTFTPAVLGVSAMLKNLDDAWSGRIFTTHRGLVALGVFYALLWTFLLGGVLDHLGRKDRFDLARFAQEGARSFGVFFRLVLISGVLYFGVFYGARKLFEWIDVAIRDVTSEQATLFYYLLGASAVVGLLVVIRLIFDYAKIAAVGPYRPGALRAARQGFVFVLRRPWRTVGLYLTFLVLGGVLMLLYGLIAPVGGAPGWIGIIWAFALGQIYLVGRLWLRVGLLGSELSLFTTP